MKRADGVVGIVTKFCTKDGSKLTTSAKRRCLKCGKTYGATTKFCTRDGSRLR